MRDITNQGREIERLENLVESIDSRYTVKIVYRVCGGMEALFCTDILTRDPLNVGQLIEMASDKLFGKLPHAEIVSTTITLVQ